VSLQLRWFSGRSVVPCPSLTAHPAARDREYKLAELCPCFVKLKSLHVLEWRHPAEHRERWIEIRRQTDTLDCDLGKRRVTASTRAECCTIHGCFTCKLGFTHTDSLSRRHPNAPGLACCFILPQILFEAMVDTACQHATRTRGPASSSRLGEFVR